LQLPGSALRAWENGNRGLGVFRFLRRRRLMQRMANLRQLRKPAAVGQEAKMADPHEAFR